MKKTVLTVFLSLILSFSFIIPAFCDDDHSAPEINADYSIVLNLNTDEVIYEKNADKKAYPASTVKLMTALLAFENIDDLDTVIKVRAETVRRITGNSISLSADEELTVRQLLYAMLCNNANDAALVLADYVGGGSVDAFVSMMNDKAAELGCKNTVYKNPTGLHNAEMITTARDVGIIAKEASYNSLLVEMASTPTYTIEKTNKAKERTLYNKNLYVSSTSKYYNKDAKGLNSGNTDQSGYCLVSMSTQNGMPLLCIVLSCDKTKDGTIHSYTDTTELYKWAFSSFGNVTILKAKQVSLEMPVKLSANNDYVLLYPDRDVDMILPLGIKQNEIEKVYNLDCEYLTAPIKKDTAVGTLSLVYEGKVLATVNMMTSSDIERSDILYYLDVIGKAVSTLWFMVSAITFCVLMAIYFIVINIKDKKSKKEVYYKESRF